MLGSDRVPIVCPIVCTLEATSMLGSNSVYTGGDYHAGVQ